MIKLVAVDLDGTFLNSKRQVSVENRKIIHQIQDMGIKFVTNSGRDYNSVRMVLDESKIICDSICMNGSAIYNKEGKLIKSNIMRREDVMAIESFINQEEYFIEYNTVSGACIPVSKDKAEAYFRGWMSLYNNGDIKMIDEEEISQNLNWLKERIIYINNTKEIFERGYEINKISISHKDTKKIEKLREELSKNPNISVAASFLTNIEITDKDADKGIALEEYAKDNNIKMEEVMAFGDSLNDYPMLKREFGYTVAMENAIEAIKKVAKYQTKTNDNHGIFYFINKVVLEGKAGISN